MQSSSADGGIPQRAVDGSSGQIYSPQTCTLTRAEPRPWWYVNLLEPYMVQLVRLDFGKPCCGKLNIVPNHFGIYSRKILCFSEDCSSITEKSIWLGRNQSCSGIVVYKTKFDFLNENFVELTKAWLFQ